MKYLEKTAIASAMAIALCTQAAQADLDNIDISGLVETEISFIDSDTNGDTSDIVVPTVEFAIEGKLSEQVDVAVVLLAEDIGTDEQTDVEIYEAMINLAIGSGTLTVGQAIIPFGVYETGVISDPLTLVLGETAETIVMYGVETDSGLSVAGFLFNGDVDDGDDEINDVGLTVSMTQENWSLGIDFISNLGDSDTLGDLANPAVDDDVAGTSLHGSFSAGSLTFIAEHVMAMDEFQVGDAAGLEPSATHVELGIDLGNDSSLSLSVSSSDDAAGLLDYENQTAVAYSTTLMQHVGMTVELINAEEYGGNKDSGVTLQLAAEF